MLPSKWDSYHTESMKRQLRFKWNVATEKFYAQIHFLSIFDYSEKHYI